MSNVFPAFVRWPLGDAFGPIRAAMIDNEKTQSILDGLLAKILRDCDMTFEQFTALP
jgi:hypothetical protein